MGWTGIDTKKSLEDVFKQEFAEQMPRFKKYIILQVTGENMDDGLDEEAEVFIAFEPRPNEVCAVVILMHREGNEVRYKDMDESMGPYSKHKCPKEIMELLSPVESLKYNTYSKEWRARQ